jgi:hypothetical protein
MDVYLSVRGHRIAWAKFVAAAWLITAPGPGTLEGNSVDRLFAAKIVTSGESQGRPAHYLLHS